MNESLVIMFFENCDAIWVHNDDPAMPHAELTTGLCSNGYFECRSVLMHGWICEKFAEGIYKKLKDQYVVNPDWVVGSSYSAITLSYEVSKLFRAKHGFVEKDPSDPKGKKMIWKGGVILPTETVLQVEELITTSHTFFEVRRAMQEANSSPINFFPVVGCIIHRPPKLLTNYDEVKIVSLMEKEIWAVKPEDCRLCKAGSRRLRPRGNWAELTKKSK